MENKRFHRREHNGQWASEKIVNLSKQEKANLRQGATINTYIDPSDYENYLSIPSVGKDVEPGALLHAAGGNMIGSVWHYR